MNFEYKAKHSSGKKVNGKIEANSKESALQLLENQGLVVFDIAEEKPWNKDIVLNKRVKNKDFIIFLRQYATLIRAGISISQATKTMVKQSNHPVLKSTLRDIDKMLDQGMALSTAAKKHPKIFPVLLVNMIEAGEASGKLDDILNQMALYYEKEYRNKQKIVSALLYPGIVGVITILLSIFLLVFIVPRFVDMFVSMGEDIPAYTALIIHLSQIVGTYWWTIILCVGLIYLGYRYAMKHDTLIYHIDRIKMRIPLFGTLVHKGILVRMTQTLSILFNSAVPVLQSVEITEKVVNNRVIQDLLKKSRQSLEVGESMTTPMNHWAFPSLVVQMIQIGEKTGTLDAMLAKVAEFYEEEVEQLSSRIKVLIEPIMIVILTVMVGSIIMAIVIPMFTLFENF